MPEVGSSSLIQESIPEFNIDELIEESFGETERLAIRRNRLGQGAYRDSLLERLQGRCAVSGLAIKELLRVSHIKNWHDSDNFGRRHECNGLLLAANYDAAFDRGLITFEDNGTIRLKPNPADAALLGIDIHGKTEGLTESIKFHLTFHRTKHGF